MTVSGWGTLKSRGVAAEILQKVNVPGITNAQCNNLYNNGITGTMLCAGNVADGGVDACQGDSGGNFIKILHYHWAVNRITCKIPKTIA